MPRYSVEAFDPRTDQPVGLKIDADDESQAIDKARAKGWRVEKTVAPSSPSPAPEKARIQIDTDAATAIRRAVFAGALQATAVIAALQIAVGIVVFLVMKK